MHISSSLKIKKKKIPSNSPHKLLLTTFSISQPNTVIPNNCTTETNWICGPFHSWQNSHKIDCRVDNDIWTPLRRKLKSPPHRDHNTIADAESQQLNVECPKSCRCSWIKIFHPLFGNSNDQSMNTPFRHKSHLSIAAFSTVTAVTHYWSNNTPRRRGGWVGHAMKQNKRHFCIWSIVVVFWFMILNCIIICLFIRYQHFIQCVPSTSRFHLSLQFDRKWRSCDREESGIETI